MTTSRELPQAFLAVLGSVSMPASTFIATPLLLDRLGPGELGGFLLVLSLARIVVAADRGQLALAIPRAVSGSIWLSRSAVGYFLLEAFRKTVPAYLVVLTAGLIQHLSGRWVFDRTDSLEVWCGLVVLAAGIHFYSFNNALAVARRSFTLGFLASALASVGYLLAIVFAIRGGSGLELAVWVTAVQFFLAGSIILFVLLRRARSRHEYSMPTARTDWPAQFVTAGAILYVQAVVPIAAIVLEPDALAAVALAVQATSILRIPMASLAGYMISSFAWQDGVDSVHASVRFRRWVSIWTLLCLGAAAVGVALAGPTLRLWLGDDHPEDLALLARLALISTCSVVATLVVSSGLRARLLLGQEVIFVGHLLLSVVVAGFAGLFSSSPAALLTVLSLGTVLASIRFSVRGRRVFEESIAVGRSARHGVA